MPLKCTEFEVWSRFADNEFSQLRLVVAVYGLPAKWVDHTVAAVNWVLRLVCLA
jgi:hypothetical protein